MDGGGQRSPTLLAVDGNSLLHRAFHAGGSDDVDGRPTHHEGLPVWALRGMIGLLARSAARIRPDALVIGFDCREHSVRRSDYGGYKSHRPPKPVELEQQLDTAPALMSAAGLAVVVPAGYEADDVLASSAALASTSGWRCVAVTSDRDAFALLDETTSVLRIHSGDTDRFSLLTAQMLPDLYGVPAAAYAELAALRGDTSDNLPGVPGMGTKTAARLLATFGTTERVYAAMESGFHDLVREAVGDRLAAQLATAEARANVARNRTLMTMRKDVPLPELSSMRLPVDLTRMQAVLGTRGINLGPSLWALTGGDPPDPDDSWSAMGKPLMAAPRRRASFSRTPGPGQLAFF